MFFAGITDGSRGVSDDGCSEDALILGVAEGDRDSFRTLYLKTSKSVYAYALSILRNPGEAEDVLQDTFLKIRSCASQYRAEGKGMAWILTITRNLCLMKIRKRRMYPTVSWESVDTSEEFAGFSDAEDRIILTSAFRVLSEEEWRIIILHAVLGWKHRMIAQHLGLTLSTVLSKYRRGLKKLKEELEGTV